MARHFVVPRTASVAGTGTRHILRASAVVDAGIHAAQTGHIPAATPVQIAEPVLVLKAS